MRDVWRAVARGLLEYSVVVQGELERVGVGAWVAARTDPPPAARVRWVSDPSGVALDPFSGRRERARWDDLPGVRGTGGMRVSFDEDGAILGAVPESDADGPPRVVGRRDGDLRALIVCDRAEPTIAVRSQADGWAVEVRVAWRVVDEGLRVRQLFCGLERREARLIRRAHARGTPWSRDLPASVVGGSDELVLDGAGEAVSWRADRRERRDLAGADELGESTVAVAEAELFDAVLGCVERWIPVPAPIPVWSSRLRGSPPRLDDSDTAVAFAAEAMLRTIVRATTDVALPNPCALLLDLGRGDVAQPVLPELVVVDRAFRDRYGRRRRATPVTSELHLAPGAGEGVRTELRAVADDATLDGWLPLQRLYSGFRGVSSEERRRTADYQERLRRELTRCILDHSWPSAWETPVLPWTRLHEGSDGVWTDPWKDIAAVSPRHHRALRSVWTPPRGRRGTGAAKAGPSAVPDGPRRSRAALHRLLLRHGLGEHAPALASAARPGFRLSRARSSDAGVSRLAGPPLLPDGVSWPASADGTPLSFLAAVDRSELPVHDDELPLPSAGTLLFYVLVGDRAAWDGMPPWADEPASDPVAVLYVPAGAELVHATPPADGVLTTGGHDDEPTRRPAAAVPLRFAPVVQPVDDHDVAERFGMHPADAGIYETLASAGFGPPADDAAIGGLFLGVSSGPQGYPVDDDHVVLLALRGTPRLGTDWGSEGDLRILIRRDDLGRGRWDRAFAQGDD